MKTLYGEIIDVYFEEFCWIAGHKYTDNQFTLIADEVEYWQLINAGSNSDVNKWKKKKGWLTIRDFNFEYALYKTGQFVNGANGEQVKTYNLEAALKYAKEKLFIGGKPVYLPEYLAGKANIMSDDSKKPPKSYSQILHEEKERF